MYCSRIFTVTVCVAVPNGEGMSFLILQVLPCHSKKQSFIHFAGFTMAYYTVFCVKVPNGFQVLQQHTTLKWQLEQCFFLFCMCYSAIRDSKIHQFIHLLTHSFTHSFYVFIILLVHFCTVINHYHNCILTKVNMYVLSDHFIYSIWTEANNCMPQIYNIYLLTNRISICNSTIKSYRQFTPCLSVI